MEPTTANRIAPLAPERDSRRPSPGPSRGRHAGRIPTLVIVLIALATLAGIAVLAIMPRLEARTALEKDSVTLNTPTVAVIKPKLGSEAQEIVLPGNMEPFIDTPIYARTNGYLKRWTVDIGARVKEGDLLAEIDTPEVDDQLRQARADVQTAMANYEIAKRTSDRWQELVKTGTVSKQQADQMYSEMQARKAALDSANFNVARLEKMQSFKKIYAPFDGVITARKTDVGALLDAGSQGAGRELFHIASTKKLRVYVNVPQLYSRDVADGMEADLTLAEYPGRHFTGKVVRNTKAIDVASRTLLTEVDVDNASGELLPGSYTQVHLKLKATERALVLPVNAMLFRAEGMQVAVVTPDQRVALKNVQLGRDFGTQVEILSGLDANDQVIVNPSDSLVAGTQVRVVKPAESKPGEQKPAEQKAAKS